MVNILWTGGWDSTFRVLDLVIHKKKTIQPYYVMDKGRKSTEMEIKTMEKIKSLIVDLNPSLRNNILETIFIEKQKVPENKVITKKYQDLAKEYQIGSQYDWLARYADAKGINDLELSIHIDDRAYSVIKNDVEQVSLVEDTFFKLKGDYSFPELKVFSYFHYPVLMLSKLEMDQVAKERGYSHIMEVTWFCHTPNGNQPCGLCNPCKYTRDEGLGRRVPEPSVSYKTKVLLSKVKRKVLNS